MLSYRARLIVPIVLQPVYFLLFLTHKVKHTGIQHIFEIMYIHRKELLARNVTPLNQRGIDKYIVAFCIINGDSNINIIQNCCEDRCNLKLKRFVHRKVPPYACSVYHMKILYHASTKKQLEKF